MGLNVNKINKGHDLSLIINLVLYFDISKYKIPIGDKPSIRFNKLISNNDIKNIYDMSRITINKKLFKEYYNIPTVEIQIINESLKKSFNYSFILKHHTKEFWLQKMLVILKEKSIEIISDLSKKIGYDYEYEHSRCSFDNRVVYIRNQFLMKYFKHIEYNQNCTLITNDNHFSDLLGDTPKYNRSLDSCDNEVYIVMDIYGFPSYIFEENSFFDYFTNRDRTIDDILT